MPPSTRMTSPRYRIAGAVFHVTSGSDPRAYTVSSGATLTGAWVTSPGQDVRVHGPNGFYRQFAGESPDITPILPQPLDEDRGAGTDAGGRSAVYAGLSPMWLFHASGWN